MLEPSKEGLPDILALFTGFHWEGGLNFCCQESVRCAILARVMKNDDLARVIREHKRTVLRSILHSIAYVAFFIYSTLKHLMALILR